MRWYARVAARATERECFSIIWILLSCLILSFFILQYLCINSITISYHLFLINSLFQSTKYIRFSLKQSYSFPKSKTNYSKFNILLMKSLNFSLLYSLRRKWKIPLLRDINPQYLSVPIDLILDNIYCTYNVTLH